MVWLGHVASFLEAKFPSTACVAGELEGMQGSLYPEEVRYAMGCCQKRQREFVAGRTAARIAMERLGVAPTALPRGERREPVWPSGIVGSITHTGGYCIAFLARSSDYASLGVDIEQPARVGQELLGRIVTSKELQMLKGVANIPVSLGAALIFSAKEAAFKLLYPLFGEELSFKEAEATLFFDQGCFRIQILRFGFPVVEGVFINTEDVVITACALKEKGPGR